MISLDRVLAPDGADDDGSVDLGIAAEHRERVVKIARRASAQQVDTADPNPLT
jgi:hypothetical protein